MAPIPSDNAELTLDQLLTEHRPVASLHPHPLNSRLFRSLTELELQLLADDMQAHGLQYGIDILPDGRIICGYHRWLAAQLLGWTEIRCRVRHDLEAQGEEAILQHLIADNVLRRQIDPLGHAQLYVELRKEIRKSIADPADSKSLCDLRDQIAKLIGQKSGRTLDRDLRILREAPAEVVESVREGKLSKKDAGAVINMSKAQQAEVAGRIEAGEEPSVVVRSFADSRSDDHRLQTMAKNLRKQLQAVVRRKQESLGSDYEELLAKAVNTGKQIMSLVEELTDNCKSP